AAGRRAHGDAARVARCAGGQGTQTAVGDRIRPGVERRAAFGCFRLKYEIPRAHSLSDRIKAFASVLTVRHRTDAPALMPAVISGWNRSTLLGGTAMTSHTSFYRRGALVFAAYCVSTLFALVPVQVFASGVDVPVSQPILTDNTLLWQVAPDECFNGIGVDYPPMNPDGTCPVGQPKANQSYIWGLTEQSGKLWFGTMANTYCTLSGVVDVTPKVTPNVVCEYAESEFARTYPSIPANRGDWRAPAIYSWDLASGTLTQQPVTAPLLQTTLGLRGAGSIDNIAFL